MSEPDVSGEPNFYEYLRTQPAVAAICGDSIFYQRARGNMQGPFVVYQRAGASRQATFCGMDSTVGAEYQFDIYARDDVVMANLARAIRRALLDDSHPMGAFGVKKILPDQDFDSVDPDPGLNRRTQTYTVWYAED